MAFLRVVLSLGGEVLCLGVGALGVSLQSQPKEVT